MRTIYLLSASLSASLLWSSAGFAEILSKRICDAAVGTFQQAGADEILLLGTSPTGKSGWIALPQHQDTPIIGRIPTLYLAYFTSGPYGQVAGEPNAESAGAVSVKVSTFINPSDQKASEVELYRPSIAPGADKCEAWGRPEIADRRVALGAYVRYHQRIGNSAAIRDFHIRYPYGRNNCARTDQPGDIANTFQFPGVAPVDEPSLIAKLLTSPAYAANGSHLRSELHYYNRIDSKPFCVGFGVQLDRPLATIEITDLSSNTYSPRGRWSLHLQ